LDGRGEDIWRESRLRSTPTNVCASVIVEADDYGSKVSINVRIRGG
jgi:hypothetical protein